MDDRTQTLKVILDALTSIVAGKFDNEFTSPTDDELSVEIFHCLNTLISHLKEINTAFYELADGNLDGTMPERKNYLAAPFKTLHSRLSNLTWHAKQAIKHRVVNNMPFNGELYKTINDLIDQIADSSLNQLTNTESNGMPANSWKYHQLLLALGRLAIMILLVNDKGEIVYANEKAKTIFSKVTSFSEVKISDDKELISCIASLVTQEKPFAYPRKEIFDTSRSKWFTIVSENIVFLNTQAFQMYMINDITDWKENEIKLEKMADTDEMTGLYNKRGGLRKVRQFIENFDETGEHCVALIDLDGLKFTNDTFGHIEGDFFIKKVADTLINFSRQTDILIRFGGDEFVIFFMNCAYNNALNRLYNVLQELEKFNKTSHKPYKLGFSFGVIQFDYTPDMDILKVIEQADKRMYTDKKYRKTMYK